MIARIEALGAVASECPLPGERFADGFVAAHPNAWQLARDRWLLTYSTRGARGSDDEHALAYQVRRDSPLGPVLAENFVRRHDPEQDAGKPFYEYGHATCFGVPKGARLRGREVPHAGVFAMKWRATPKKWIAPDVVWVDEEAVRAGTRPQLVEWVQFRLNTRGDDLEFLQPAQRLRQQGFEEGEAFCEVPGSSPPRIQNAGFVPSVPFNDDASEWVDVNHFGWRVAAMKYRFDSKRGFYVWVQTGPYVPDPAARLFEPCVARWKDSFVVGIRLGTSGKYGGPNMQKPGMAWLRVEDPFAPLPDPTYRFEIPLYTPRTAWTCPDGVLRMLSNDSSYRMARDPLFIWDVDPDREFEATNRRVIYDSFVEKPGIPDPRADFGKLVPHAGGDSQVLLHRLQTQNLSEAAAKHHRVGVLTPEMRAKCGVHAARITYTEPLPPAWNFDP